MEGQSNGRGGGKGNYKGITCIYVDVKASLSWNIDIEVVGVHLKTC